jgi:hypothetical protein
MADLKISDFTAATLPLDGSELLAGVHDGDNIKIPVSAITTIPEIIDESTAPVNSVFRRANGRLGFKRADGVVDDGGVVDEGSSVDDDTIACSSCSFE